MRFPAGAAVVEYAPNQPADYESAHPARGELFEVVEVDATAGEYGEDVRLFRRVSEPHPMVGCARPWALELTSVRPLTRLAAEMLALVAGK